MIMHSEHDHFESADTPRCECGVVIREDALHCDECRAAKLDAAIGAADDWDSCDDGGMTLGLKVECFECGEAIRFVKPTFDFIKAEWIVSCPSCETELGRKD